MARKEFNTSRAAGMQENYTVKHYTPEKAVKDLLSLIPFEENDIALDPASGHNKVWYRCFPCRKDEVEIEEGKDFFKYTSKVDWVVGNPPFRDFVKYLLYAPNIARKGFAFLIGHSRINQITPKRLSDIESKGFYLSKMHICTFKAWFGRYYFVVFTRQESDSFSYTRWTYDMDTFTPSEPTGGKHPGT